MLPKRSMEEVELGYSRVVRTRALDVLRNGPKDILSLSRETLGVFPTDLALLLEPLVRSGRLTLAQGVYSRAETMPDECKWLPRARGDRWAKLYPTYPEPHPLDYDWRFSLETIRRSLRLISGHVGANATIALLGTPSLALFAPRGTRGWTLFERSPALVRGVREERRDIEVVQHDLFDPIRAPRRRFDAVIADPPWYPEHYAAFVERSSDVLVEGGLLFLSMLPTLTRPRARLERRDAVAVLYAQGFDLVRVEEGCLEYECPPFEESALQCLGIPVAAWRRGDLFVCRMVSRPVRSSQRCRRAQEDRWDEVCVGSVRVFIARASGSGASVFRVSTIEDGCSVFKSVSRRNPLRRRANVWTSRNAAFEVSSSRLARSALEMIACGESIEDVTAKLRNAHGLDGVSRDHLRLLLQSVAGA